MTIALHTINEEWLNKFNFLNNMNIAIPERRRFHPKRLMSVLPGVWAARRRDTAGERGPPSPGPPRSGVWRWGKGAILIYCHFTCGVKGVKMLYV